MASPMEIIDVFRRRHASLLMRLQELYPCTTDHAHAYTCYTEDQVRAAQDPKAPKPAPTKTAEIARLMRDVAAQLDSGNADAAFERVSLTVGPAGAGFYFRIEGVVR